MSSPNNPKNGKGKKKADDTSKADNSSTSGSNNSTSGDSNSFGSTTPRATPRTPSTSTLGANANASSSSTPSHAPVSSAFPRSMPPIDHSINLQGYNFMPSASQKLPAPSPAPFSYDGIFGELQRRFTSLSEKERHIRDAQKKVIEAAEKDKRESEKTQQERKIVGAQCDAAVKVENDNEKEKKPLTGLEAELKQRLADLERREVAFERRVSIYRYFASDALGAAIDAVGRTAPRQHTHDPMSSAGDFWTSYNLFQQHTDNLFSSAVDNPPRGRTLSGPHILEHQLLSTTSSDMPSCSRENQYSHIPIRPRTIQPRPVSSENLSLASPTPRRALRGEDLRRSEEFGSVPGDVYDSSGEEEGGDSSAGVEEPVEAPEMEAEVVQRPRERSVRRVSRNENLRR